VKLNGEPVTASEADRQWLRCETGAAWLDLVATVGKAYGPAPIERLDSAGRLGDWLATEDLRPEAPPGETDLIQACELREALRSLALATVRARRWPNRDIVAVNDALAADRPLELRAAYRHGPGVREPATAREALARIARQAAQHLTGPEAATLGTCADSECGMLFLDPGGRRRWCASEICGVRNRVRAHRLRKAEA
jgi:predicted RNA-binding Zn ribbon-like protein